MMLTCYPKLHEIEGKVENETEKQKKQPRPSMARKEKEQKQMSYKDPNPKYRVEKPKNDKTSKKSKETTQLSGKHPNYDDVKLNKWVNSGKAEDKKKAISKKNEHQLKGDKKIMKTYRNTSGIEPSGSSTEPKNKKRKNAKSQRKGQKKHDQTNEEDKIEDQDEPNEYSQQEIDRLISDIYGKNDDSQF